MKYSDDLIEEVIIALDNANYEVKYYFNKETQKVDYYSEYFDDEQAGEEDKIDFSDWIEIAGIPSYEKYNLMQDFTEMQNERLQDILFTALDGKGAFRRFKNALGRFPEKLDEWYDFEHEWFKKKAIDFLDYVYE